MEKQKKIHRQPRQTADLCVNPQNRLCEKFDPTGIAKFTVAQPGQVDARVVDSCAEEHIM